MALPHPPLRGDLPRNPDPRRAAWKGLDQSSVMSVELMSALLTWGGLGWLADRWLSTGPWFMAVGVLLGFVLGLYLIWLRAARMDAEEAQGRG